MQTYIDNTCIQTVQSSLKFNNNKTTKLKQRKYIKRYITKEDIKLTNTWKDVQPNLSLGLCKLKQWWNTTTPTRLAKIQITDNTKCLWGLEAVGILIHCCWEYKMIQLLWKIICKFPTKLNICLAYDLAIVLLDIC